MPTTVSNILDRAMEVLRDNEPGTEEQTWSRLSLLDWLNEGLTQVATLRPDAFTQVVSLPLQAGAHQTLPAGYEAIYGIEGNVQGNPDGTSSVADDVSNADAAMLKRFKKKPCLASDLATGCGDVGSGYRVKSFIRGMHNSKTFRVDPPVPYGAQVEVMATVKLAAPRYGVEDMNADVSAVCSNVACLLDWILHRAYAIETESEYHRTAKNDYWRYFYASINGQYMADSRMTSGYVLGQEGTGEEQSGPARDLRNFSTGGGN